MKVLPNSVSGNLGCSRMNTTYCIICARVRGILMEAPWANYDLILSFILTGVGIYMIASPGMFETYSGVYKTLARLGDERLWGATFVVFGIASFLLVAWPFRPPFLFRLLGRVGAAFCLWSFAFNNWSNSPPPISTIPYTVLAVAALIGVMRTRYAR